MGTPEFAVPPLQALIDNGYEIVGVFTQPDRPAGRGNKLTACPVKQLAVRHNLPVYQFEKIRRRVRPDSVAAHPRHSAAGHGQRPRVAAAGLSRPRAHQLVHRAG